MSGRSKSLVVTICFWVVILAVRSGVLLAGGGRLTADRDGYRALAANLAEHGVLGTADRPSAYRPPLYPLLVAVCVGGPWPAQRAIALLHLVLGLGTVWLAIDLGRRCGLGDYRWLAGALVACDPILLNQSTLVMTETLAAFLATLSLVFTTATSQASGKRRIACAALSGLSFAFAALCRPTFLVSLLLVGAALTLAVRPARQRIAMFATFSIAAAVVLAPWMARNAFVFGKPIVSTTHGGYTLLLGNNTAYYDFLSHAPWRAVWNAEALDARLRAERTADEIADDRGEYQLAWQVIGARPGMFLYATLRRCASFWGILPHRVTGEESPPETLARYVTAVWYLSVFILALVPVAASMTDALRGMARKPAQSSAANIVTSGSSATASDGVGMESSFRPPLFWAVLLIASFNLVHLVYWTDMRMRAPVMPALCLLAAAGAKRLLAH